MKYLIIEDEPALAKRLANLIAEIEPEATLLGMLDSVEEAVEWLSTHPHPDLLFLDIQLADGLSFDIFKQVEIKTPVIFTTAFDNYAIQAFKVNSVDYLLKPVNRDELKNAIEKFKQTGFQKNPADFDLSKLAAMLKSEPRKFLQRLLVKFGSKLKAVGIEEIACFYTDNKTVYLHTFTNDRYPIDDRLDALEHSLDPQQFFRINRTAIINFGAIENMYAYSKSRVNVELKKPLTLSFVSSTERSSDFKEWLGGNV
jgi:DNA-binding LytR/AlgR family response regulator